MKSKKMNFKVVIASLALLGSFAPAYADLALAQKNACMACHAVDKKVLGPAYQAVADKYAKEKDYAPKLAASIRAGGAGKWGPIPMPAQAALSEHDAVTLAKWVLAGAK